MVLRGSEAPPNLDGQRVRAIELKVLRRIDPSIVEVLISAGSVALYDRDAVLDQWRRKNIEGSLFVVKRNMQPRFQLVVMNRLSTENLLENILGDFKFDVQTPYLIYKNAALGFDCIWFDNPLDCEAVANIFRRILQTYSTILSKTEMSLSSSTELEELEAVPSSTEFDGPLEPMRLPTTTASDIDVSSLENYLNVAKLVGNAPKKTIAGHSLQYSEAFSSPSYAPVTTASLMPTFQCAPPSKDFLGPAFFLEQCTTSSTLQSVSSAAPLDFLSVNQATHKGPLQQSFPILHESPPPLTSSRKPEKTLRRSAVHDALLRLVQREDFIDMVSHEMLKAARHP